MEETMRMEAKEHVISGVEKMTSAEGVDFQGAAKYIKEQMDR